jgi:hypothetical protein
MELAVYLQSAVRNFSRYDKYTIGAELRNHTRAIIHLIIRANSSADKRAVLGELTEQYEMLKTGLVF